jgi:hypothetical protein
MTGSRFYTFREIESTDEGYNLTSFAIAETYPTSDGRRTRMVRHGMNWEQFKGEIMRLALQQIGFHVEHHL